MILQTKHLLKKSQAFHITIYDCLLPNAAAGKQNAVNHGNICKQHCIYLSAHENITLVIAALIFSVLQSGVWGLNPGPSGTVGI